MVSVPPQEAHFSFSQNHETINLQCLEHFLKLVLTFFLRFRLFWTCLELFLLITAFFDLFGLIRTSLRHFLTHLNLFGIVRTIWTNWDPFGPL